MGDSKLMPKNKAELCRAKCRNGSICLNYAKYNGFCCKHKNKTVQVGTNAKKVK